MCLAVDVLVLLRFYILGQLIAAFSQSYARGFSYLVINMLFLPSWLHEGLIITPLSFT